MRKQDWFVAIIMVHLLIVAAFLLWPSLLETPVGLLAFLPFLGVYLLSMAGVPWLLANLGVCGWGWCAPSVFGWLVLAVLWLALMWALAGFLAWLLGRRKAAQTMREAP